MDKWQINHGKRTCVVMLKLRIVKSEVAQMQCLFKQKQNCWWQSGNVISKLCASQATINESVIRFTEPLGADWRNKFGFSGDSSQGFSGGTWTS